MNLYLSLALGILFLKIKADDGINLTLFTQNDYQLTFERIELMRYNHEIFDEFSLVTFKYNRSIAVVNVTFISKVDLGHDFRAVVQGFKFLSNEYRTFAIRFGANGCQAIDNNIAGMMTGFKRCGNYTGCPACKGRKYHICNWYPDSSKLPPLIPNGEYKFEVQGIHSAQEMMVLNVYVTIFRPIVWKD